MKKVIEALGALKPKIDTRDYKVKASAFEYPTTWSCSELMPVKNQRHISSCVAHALSTILEFFEKKENGTYKALSTDFIYGMQGIAYGRKTPGMYLRDACKIAKNYGDTLETTIPGNTEQPKCMEKLEKKINDVIYSEANNHKVKSYASCKTDNDIKYALMNYGPVLVSIKWYDKYSFVDEVIQMNKATSCGYHAIVIYGWNEKGWLCQNSWGKYWNKNGRFIYPFSEKISEAWSFVDADNDDIVIPKTNNFLNFFYKLLNYCINLFRKN